MQAGKQIIPHPNRDEPSSVAGAPTCPKGLDAIAKKKWKAVVKLMTEAGTITRLDGDLLESYCEAYSRRQRALEKLKGESEVLEGENGCYQNPILHVANKALDQMIRLSKLLGLDKLTAKKLGVIGGKTKKKDVATRNRSEDVGWETA